MKIAIWIIAICSLVRIIQNGIQLSMLLGERELRKNLNNEFIDSLKKDNREWAQDLLKDFLNDADRAYYEGWIRGEEAEQSRKQTDCAWK